MSTQAGKRTANLKVTLNKRNVESLKSAEKPFIAWGRQTDRLRSSSPAYRRSLLYR